MKEKDKSNVSDGCYIVIQSFMVKDLNLKGNDLLIYAIIYGFSQDRRTNFSGSLKYLSDWTNSTKQGVLKNLQNLIEADLIEKKESSRNGVKIVEYKTKFTTIKQSLPPLNFVERGIKQSLPNNIDNINNINNNTDNNINNNIDYIKYIVDLLNEKAGTFYRASTPKTVSLIKARIKEGFSVKDFESVIENMVSEWKGTDMDKYLRPETLFGTKFESYLNRKKKVNDQNNSFDTDEFFEAAKKRGFRGLND